jgi:dUTP pyrophosphatase
MKFIKNFVNFGTKKQKEKQKMSTLKFKKLRNEAVLPSRAHTTDAGLDLTCTHYERHDKDNYIEYRFGLAVEIPAGHVGLLVARSNVTKKDFILKNSIGIIDADYRGEIIARFHLTKPYSNNIYARGDRVCQLVVVPVSLANAEFVDELSDTNRGQGAFGSSGGVTNV